MAKIGLFASASIMARYEKYKDSGVEWIVNRVKNENLTPIFSLW